jgi:hypothetical protein
MSQCLNKLDYCVHLPYEAHYAPDFRRPRSSVMSTRSDSRRKKIIYWDTWFTLGHLVYGKIAVTFMKPDGFIRDKKDTPHEVASLNNLRSERLTCPQERRGGRWGSDDLLRGAPFPAEDLPMARRPSPSGGSKVPVKLPGIWAFPHSRCCCGRGCSTPSDGGSADDAAGTSAARSSTESAGEPSSCALRPERSGIGPWKADSFKPPAAACRSRGTGSPRPASPRAKDRRLVTRPATGGISQDGSRRTTATPALTRRLSGRCSRYVIWKRGRCP